MAGLLRRWIPPGADVVVATSWGKEFTDFLGQSAGTGAFALDALARLSPDLNRSLVPERSERAFIASLHLAQARAGYGTLLGLDRAFDAARYHRPAALPAPSHPRRLRMLGQPLRGGGLPRRRRDGRDRGLGTVCLPQRKSDRR